MSRARVVAVGCMMLAGMIGTKPTLANGPAWVAELSQVQPERGDSVDIWLPVGEYTTVGVYNTDAVEIASPETVKCDVWCIWYGQRTTFKDRPEERDVAVPYYLPPLKYWPTSDSFAVRMRAEAEGEHIVRIECNPNVVTVTLHVGPSVPPADCGYGFYTDYLRYGYPEHERQYFEHMRDYGANTFTPYGWQALDGGDIARQIDTALAVGLLDPQFPLFVLPDCAGSDFTALIEDARAKAKHSDEWPELIAYNRDEPGEAQREEVAELARNYHDGGYRTGTAISGQAALAFGEILDICCIHMDGVTRAVREKLQRDNVEFWTYNCTLRGTNAPLHRYSTGVWTWKVRPKVKLTWSYMNNKDSKIREDGTWNALQVCEHALDTPDGPISTVGLEGGREGIVDYRVLRELERQIAARPDHERAAQAAEWLQDLADRVDTGFWPGGRKPAYAQYYWDVPDTAVPPVTEFNEIRKQAIEYINALRAG